MVKRALVGLAGIALMLVGLLSFRARRYLAGPPVFVTEAVAVDTTYSAVPGVSPQLVPAASTDDVGECPDLLRDPASRTEFRRTGSAYRTTIQIRGDTTFEQKSGIGSYSGDGVEISVDCAALRVIGPS